MQGIARNNCKRCPDREKMNRLRTCYEGASKTANACSLALMKRKTAENLNQRIIGQFLDYLVIGVDPSIMAIGPSKAIPQLARNNRKIED